MIKDQKRRKRTVNPLPTNEQPSVQRFLEQLILLLQTLSSERGPISLEHYKGLLKEELIRLERYVKEPPGEVSGLLSEENRIHREFLFKTFHEMRNPLHAIMGYAGLVLRKTRDQIPLSHQENLEKVIESADRLKELVDKMVAYYREK